MSAEIIKIDPGRPEPAFARSREVVSRGGVIVYPTETFYGLGVDPHNQLALERLFRIKGRAVDQPILLLIHDARDVTEWAAEVTAEAERLMKLHWPGPLTLVFRAQEQVLPLITAGKGAIGLRVPGNALTRRLLAFLGTALTGTSANVSGERSLRTAHEAAAALGPSVDLILDAGPTPGGRPSTVVDVAGTGRAAVIREGAIDIKL
jgi:L-threonylcarbamoyladenylate synthase